MVRTAFQINISGTYDIVQEVETQEISKFYCLQNFEKVVNDESRFPESKKNICQS